MRLREGTLFRASLVAGFRIRNAAQASVASEGTLNKGFKRDVKRGLAMHVYISYLSRSVYMERILPGRFSDSSCHGKTESRLKRDNFYHINTHIMLTLQIVSGEIVPGS